jgi:hypothetical protein
MSKQQKQAQGISGFVVILMRWVVERSNAWVERCIVISNNSGTLKALDHPQSAVYPSL